MSDSGDPADAVLPLARYAALGDGRTVALTGANGSIDWWCLPDLDSTPFFDRLLDPDGGRFSVTPEGPFTVERHYRPGSNVLEQVFETKTGKARITDSLNSSFSGRLPWSELARRIEGLGGEVSFSIEMQPGRRLGQANSWREDNPHGDVLHVAGLVCAVRFDGAEMLARDDHRLRARLKVTAGSRHVLAVLASADGPLILPSLAEIDKRIERSDEAWREWCANLNYTGAFGDDVRRSALALKLLLFSPTGAIAAAATSSLPERIGGPKNYDYRYAWVRDVAYTIKALLRIGASEESKAAFAWLADTALRHGGKLNTMYRLDGSIAPGEQKLDLPGYRDSRPVQRGNKATSQTQLGIYGDVLETAALFVAEGHVLDLPTRRLLADLTDHCADIWRNRDSGIWELEQLEHYTISKIGCWAAMDRAVSLAGKGQIETGHVARWQRERDRIRDWIDAECWSDSKQAYTLHAGTDRLDASVMLGTRFGFERRDRLALTRDAICRELCRGPLVYRYSGMEDEEGSFTACGFWLAEAIALLGDNPGAVRQMQGMLAACGGNLGLLTEQIDPATGEMLGNVPQALSHLALIDAATAITEMSK